MKKSQIFLVAFLLALNGCSRGSITPEVGSVTPTAINPATGIDDSGNVIAVYEIKDGGFLSNNPCGAPCFFGIVPDITRDEDALKIINEQTDIFVDCQNFNNESEGGLSGVDCISITIGFAEGRVSDIFFYPSKPIFLKDVIERFGFPNSVDIYETNLPEYPITTKVDLFFDQILTMISPAEYNGGEIVLTPETKILEIAYFGNARYKHIYELGHLKPWSGFGKYSASK